MKIKIKMPKLGMSMQSAVILQWLKSEGQQIKKGEPLVEIQTEKVDTVVESAFNGTLLKILAEIDNNVPVGTVIVEIESTQTSEAMR